MYHFHRIFRAMVGCPVGEYIRRRRLTRAGQRLIETKQRILDIAFESRFESQESFTRAFKQLYGVSPGEYRRNARCIILQRPEILPSTTRGFTMEYKLLKRPAMKVAALSKTFNHETRGGIPMLWDQFLAQLPKIKHQVSDESFGISEEVSAQESANGFCFLYSVAVEISREEDLPEGFVCKSFPEATYLIFTHKGPVSALPATVDKVWAEWLPQAPYKRKEATPFDFELYDKRFKGQAPDSEVDICIPVEA
jgi:AraC family transcriptional regulator